MRLAPTFPLLAALALSALPARAQTDYTTVATAADLTDGGTLSDIDIACMDRAPDGRFIFFNDPTDDLVAYDAAAPAGSRTTVLRTNAEIDADTGGDAFACRALAVDPAGAVFVALGGEYLAATTQEDIVYRLAAGVGTRLTDPASAGDNGDGITGLDVSGTTVYLARAQFFGAPEDGFYRINAITPNQDPTVVLQNPSLDLFDLAVGADGTLYSNSSEFGVAPYQNVVVSVTNPLGAPALNLVYDPFAAGVFTNGTDGGLEDVEYDLNGQGRLYLFNNSFGALTGEQWGFVNADGTNGEQFASQAAMVADPDVVLTEYTPPGGTHMVYEDGVVYEASRSAFSGFDEIVAILNAPPIVAVSADIDAVNAPVVVGPGGGALTYTVTLRNNTAQPQGVDAWVVATLPNGSTRTIAGPVAVTLPAGQSTSRTLSANVPGAAPAGTYTLTLNVGDAPSAVTASNSFQFVKVAAAGAARTALAEGAVTSEALDFPAASASAVAPAAEAAAYPNPARGRTAIRFALSEATEVRLAVYDALGREVAVLLEGRVEAGAHAAAFDGRHLPGGVYVWRLVAGGQAQAGRLTLVE